MSELQRVLEELKEIKTRLKYQNRLGLSGGRKYIAIEADKKSLWHYCDDDGTIIDETILTGYIDYEYVLVSGFSTHFSRQAMAAIASMSSQQLALPVIIKPDTGNDDSKTKGKKPVFCNLIQDGRTIRSGQLGTRDAEELYQMAIAILSGVGGANQVSKSRNQPTRSPQPVRERPPALDDALPPIPPMQAIAPDFDEGEVSASMGQQSVDWKAFCKKHEILPGVLKALAQELGLPMGKLNPRQSALLYHQAYAKFVREAV